MAGGAQATPLIRNHSYIIMILRNDLVKNPVVGRE